jgi:DNA-directed RNA polymerase alpha subunit
LYIRYYFIIFYDFTILRFYYFILLFYTSKKKEAKKENFNKQQRKRKMEPAEEYDPEDFMAATKEQDKGKMESAEEYDPEDFMAATKQQGKRKMEPAEEYDPEDFMAATKQQGKRKMWFNRKGMIPNNDLMKNTKKRSIRKLTFSGLQQHIDGQHIKFKINGITDEEANALRRSFQDEVPTLAIEEVIVKENTTVLYDQMLVVQRLAFVTINSEKMDELCYPEHCLCKQTKSSTSWIRKNQNVDYCNECSRILELNVFNDGEEVYKVTEKDFICITDPDILKFKHRPDWQQIEIVDLAPGQKIRLNAIVRKGRGLQHRKWTPVSICNFDVKKIITLDHNAINQWTNEERQGLIDCCPRQVFRLNTKGDSCGPKTNEIQSTKKKGNKNPIHTVDIEDALKCNDCEECYKYVDEILGLPRRVVAITYEDEEEMRDYYFELETTGQLSPLTVLRRGIEWMMDDMKSLVQLL